MRQSNQQILKNLIHISNSVFNSSRDHYNSLGLTHVAVPKIVGITGACENVDTLFKIGNRLGIALFFTQTGQLSLEQALQHFPGVYTIIQSGRDEEIEDERHTRLFSLTEEEFDWSLIDESLENYDEEKMYEALLEHIEDAVKTIAGKTLQENAEIFERDYGRDVSGLLSSLKKPFWRISYDDSIGLLRENGFPDLEWGDDLKANHEAAVIKILNNGEESARPVFIMRYPEEIKFFNMKVWSKDDRLALSADLIFPVAGEGVGAAVREDDGEKLNNRLLSSTMFRLHKERGGEHEDFRWYLDLVYSKKTKPHAGYGLGNERLIQYLSGQKDIRLCSVFRLMAEETGDWKARSKH